MQSIKRASLYGFLLWFIWTLIVVVAYEIMPSSIADSAFFGSMKTVLLVAFVIGLTILYMKKVGSNGIFTAKEGFIIGIFWVLLMIIFDFLHYTLMHGGFKPDTYFFMASSYSIIPFITITLMGYLRYKK